MKSDDPVYDQTVIQEVFEACLCEYFTEYGASSAATLTEVTDVELTVDEMNVIRYVGGYVARSLLKNTRSRKTKCSSILNSLIVWERWQ